MSTIYEDVVHKKSPTWQNDIWAAAEHLVQSAAEEIKLVHL